MATRTARQTAVPPRSRWPWWTKQCSASQTTAAADLSTSGARARSVWPAAPPGRLHSTARIRRERGGDGRRHAAAHSRASLPTSAPAGQEPATSPPAETGAAPPRRVRTDFQNTAYWQGERHDRCFRQGHRERQAAGQPHDLATGCPWHDRRHRGRSEPDHDPDARDLMCARRRRASSPPAIRRGWRRWSPTARTRP